MGTLECARLPFIGSNTIGEHVRGNKMELPFGVLYCSLLALFCIRRVNKVLNYQYTITIPEQRRRTKYNHIQIFLHFFRGGHASHPKKALIQTNDVCSNFFHNVFQAYPDQSFPKEFLSCDPHRPQRVNCFKNVKIS